MPFAPLNLPLFGDGSLGDLSLTDGTELVPASLVMAGPKNFRNLTIGQYNTIKAPTTGYGPLIIRCTGLLHLAGRIDAADVGEVYNSSESAWIGNGADHDITGNTTGTGPTLGPGLTGTFISPKWPTFTICGGSGGGGASSAGGVANPGDVGNSGTTKLCRPLALNALSGGTTGANPGHPGDDVYAVGFSAEDIVDGEWVLCVGGGGGYGGKPASGEYSRGGNGGGLIIIAARRIVVTASGIIAANGAAGESALAAATRAGNPSDAPGIGGGGGGAGGGVFITCQNWANAVANDANITVAGGAGGIGGSGAGNGGIGGTGVKRIWKAA